MSRPGGRPCDPEGVFQLADGVLDADREREVLDHLRECPDCRELYKEELDLSARIGLLMGDEAPSVCREVAMSLPTRQAGVRLAWAGLAMALLLFAYLALSLDGANPASFAFDALGAFWGIVSGLSDVVRSLLASVGTALLVALGIGAFIDLVIAGVILFISRRRTREA